MYQIRVRRNVRRPSIPGCCVSGTPRESGYWNQQRSCCRCPKCLEFRATRQRAYNKLNKADISARRFQAKPAHYALYFQAKTRAIKKKLPFNIEMDDAKIPAVCPVLGIPLFKNPTRLTGKRGQGPNSPSLDKIVPELGYVKGNVMVISALANRIKNNGTPEQVMAVAMWMHNAMRCMSKAA